MAALACFDGWSFGRAMEPGVCGWCRSPLAAGDPVTAGTFAVMCRDCSEGTNSTRRSA